jgi:sugar lactone lactonase YvrE
MADPRRLTQTFAACAVLGLSACSGSSSQIEPGAERAASSSATSAGESASAAAEAAAKTTRVLFVSDEGSPNLIQIYAQKNPNAGPIAQISDGVSTPDGMAIDPSGNLYVANAGNDTVAVYPPGKTSPSSTYSDGLATPANVAVGNDGTVYVVNLNGGTEFVNEYAPGSMTPTLKIPAPSNYYENGLAVDPSGNLYVSYHNSSGQGWVYKYPFQSASGTNLELAVHTPAGLVVDKNGNLIVADATLPAAILVFPPGATQPSLKVMQGVGNPS